MSRIYAISHLQSDPLIKRITVWEQHWIFVQGLVPPRNKSVELLLYGYLVFVNTRNVEYFSSLEYQYPVSPPYGAYVHLEVASSSLTGGKSHTKIHL